MNKIFKVIWSKARNCYVVVSELAKSHDDGHVRRSRSGCCRKAAVLAAFALTTSLAAVPVWAADGNGNITNNEASTMTGSNTINQSKSSVIYGSGNTVENSENAVVVGKGNKGNTNSVVIGNGAQSNAKDQIVIGGGKANGDAVGSIVIGNSEAIANTSQSVIIGNYAKANGIILTSHNSKEAITREQFAFYLWSYAQAAGMDMNEGKGRGIFDYACENTSCIICKRKF